MRELSSSSEGPLRHTIDLNGDREPEMLLTSPSILCGSRGCPFVVLAGSSKRVIGRFFGELAILDERLNGYRILQSYRRYLGDATSLDTYVFDGKTYRLVSHVIVDGCGFEQWHRRMRKGSWWQPPPRPSLDRSRR